ncbi:MAG: hypothetical protein E6I22_01460 [Chloroflexi bacterium]|nr:MAG: hypothetical protein E6I22_01460 [Chloroflexota bacterium]TMG39852.1 MAG: hypothetical protein E6H92_03810 [Chloroflexota bacterium]
MWIWLSMLGELVIGGAFTYLGLRMTSRKDSRQALVMGVFLAAVCFGIAALASLWFLAKGRA